MKLKKLRSSAEVNINIGKYRADWNRPCRSQFQYDVKQWFRRFWSSQICLEEFRIPGSLLRVDLVNLNKRMLVEINGAQHDAFNKHFHSGNRVNFLKQITRDSLKREWAEDNGFLMVEITPDDMPLSREFFREKYGVDII